jgi:hypothetical protein
MDRSVLARVLIPVAALAVASILARDWPKDQTVHYVLGDAAPRVEQVDARWATDTDAKHDTWTREATFHYGPGQAPRIVTHEPRLADGNYTVEIEIVAQNDQRSTVTRHVVLGGGVTSIELARSVPR